MKIMHMLGILVLMAALALLALGGVGYNGQRGLLDAIAAQVISSDALRNHMQADMMHDALRGDVTAALLAASTKDDKALQLRAPHWANMPANSARRWKPTANCRWNQPCAKIWMR